MKNTLVIGASENPERYAFKAIQSLVKNGYPVIALAKKSGSVSGVVFDTDKVIYPDIDTVTLYVGAKNQPEYYDYVIQLHPNRVVFNPGTENEAFETLLTEKGILVERACTLVLLATNQY